MRILHTADWHLCDRLGRQDRTDDLRRAVERIAQYCKDEKVDVLLVAGDLFSELAGPDALRDAIRHLQEVFQEFLRDGGTILTLTGNHDKESFCQTLRHAMSLAAPFTGYAGELVPNGRLYLATGPTLLRLADRSTCSQYQFILMPYPDADALSARRTGPEISEPRRKEPPSDDGVHEQVERHPRQRGVRSEPANGAVGPHHRARQRTADAVSPHRTGRRRFLRRRSAGRVRLHRAGSHPQAAVPQRPPHVRYSGSIERLDLGESPDNKGVVLFDLTPEGLRGEPQVLPLDATPIYEVVVRSPQDRHTRSAKALSRRPARSRAR